MARALTWLVLVTAVAWSIPMWEVSQHGTVSVVSLVTAFMLTGMLVLFPFLNGRRVESGRVERALTCRDCMAVSWPKERAFGFCLHCGSMRPPVPSSL